MADGPYQQSQDFEGRAYQSFSQFNTDKKMITAKHGPYKGKNIINFS